MNAQESAHYLLDAANVDEPGVDALSTSLRSYAEKKERGQTLDAEFINKLVAQARQCPAVGELPRNFLYAWQHVKPIADAAWLQLYPPTPNDDDEVESEE